MASKYELPPFLEDRVPHDVYLRWLEGRAQSHAKRDRKKWGRPIRIAEHKEAIHEAVLRSRGRDAYTDEPLEWNLIGQFRDEKIPLLPTVDHLNPNSTEPDFRICGWRTNDCKKRSDRRGTPSVLRDVSARTVRVLLTP